MLGKNLLKLLACVRIQSTMSALSIYYIHQLLLQGSLYFRYLTNSLVIFEVNVIKLFVRNLCIFVISWSVFRCKLFQPSLETL